METRARGRESEGTRCCVASGGSMSCIAAQFRVQNETKQEKSWSLYYWIILP